MHKHTLFDRILYRTLAVLPDRLYVGMKYRATFGKWPDLKNPKTFNEKLTWLKLHDHNPLYTTMVDKYEAKKYVADIIGEEYIIPTYGVWDRVEDIDFDSLPDKFVLKATHDSGRVIICKDKSKLDKKKAIEEMSVSLKRNFYVVTREWPYKNVKPRIIAEHLLESEDTNKKDGHTNQNGNDINSINDYKFFCFNGKVEFMKVDFDRQTNHRANYYNRNFEILEFGEVECPPDFYRIIEKPLGFELMISLAEKLSSQFRFLRVDFYEVCGHIFFGETTFYPASATGRFTIPSVDLKIGNFLKL